MVRGSAHTAALESRVVSWATSSLHHVEHTGFLVFLAGGREEGHLLLPLSALAWDSPLAPTCLPVRGHATFGIILSSIDSEVSESPWKLLSEVVTPWGLGFLDCSGCRGESKSKARVGMAERPVRRPLRGSVRRLWPELVEWKQVHRFRQVFGGRSTSPKADSSGG